MKWTSWTLMIGLAVGGVIFYAACRTSRAGYESPPYRVVSSDGDVEIRAYESMTIVTASMGDSERGGRNRGFGKLFKYITGDNEAAQKIAMTTPVFMDGTVAGDEAPGSTMSFVVPRGVAAAGAPLPSGENVALGAIEGGRFAVMRFKGSRSGDSARKAADTLLRRLSEQGLKVVGEARFAYYDPPWTPEPLRRNEVLFRIADE